MTTKTKSQAVAADINALLRARNPLLWVRTGEEARAEKYLFEAAAAAAYTARTWDVAQGVAEMDGSPSSVAAAYDEGAKDPGAILQLIKDRATGSLKERGVWILRDFHSWVTGPSAPPTLRALRNLARLLPGIGRDNAQAVIVLTPSAEIPQELAGHATVVDWPMPDRAEIASILDAAIESLPDEYKAKAAPNGTRDAAIDAAVGLSGEEAAACYAKSLVSLKRVDPIVVGAEKKRVISRERVLEWLDPLPGGLDSVGGLDVVKTWLVARKAAYTPAARAYGLPRPKGILLTGIPGTGKTLTAKAVAAAWGVPLLKFDLGALKSKFVGESESNLRKALNVIGAIGPCVVLVDEIEKSLAGATQGAADGGVSADALGAILSWMQDRTSEAFVIATANNVEALPPELLRKGRFDDMFFVDLPNATERAEIVKASLRANGRKPVGDYVAVVDATETFTGAEIAALVPEAMFAAFADNAREIIEQDLLNAAGTTVPMATSQADKINRLKAWAKGKARPATSPEVAGKAKTGRKLDL